MSNKVKGCAPYFEMSVEDATDAILEEGVDPDDRDITIDLINRIQEYQPESGNVSKETEIGWFFLSNIREHLRVNGELSIADAAEYFGIAAGIAALAEIMMGV